MIKSSLGYYSTFSLEMYHYIVLNGSGLEETFLEIIFEFSHQLIRILITGLSPN